MKKLILSVVALVLSVPAISLADTVTYNLTLTPNPGSIYGGSGSITLEGAPSATGISDYTVANGKLDDVIFNIGGQTFTLAGATGNSLVRFLDGTLNDITFSETIGNSPYRFTFNSTANYVFYYNDGQAASYGTFSASPASTPAVPEPGSLALLATGLLGGSGELYRRFRVARAS
ncbi:MAG TPA: PEP-CTERM sorting domain-containing protein [Edaphobacter sp.]|nr:PEP-CTERM sorting domain-containing protein [Edaphobacter sp.]